MLSRCLLVLWLSIFPLSVQAQSVSLELQNASLPDAIRSLAKCLNINVMISPNIHGLATLHLQNTAPLPALDALLAMNGLAKWQQNNIWVIAPRAELMRNQQEQVKWQALSQEAATMQTRIWQIKYAKAQDLAELLQAGFLSKRASVLVDARINVLCVKDVHEHMAEIAALVKKLDVPVKQIMIQARLVSVDSDVEKALGIQFNVSHAADLPVQAGRYSLALAHLADDSLLDIRLAALEQEGRAELISSPSLFTANQQTASIEAGEEVPYQEVSESGGTAVAFKKAVLGLKVTPQLLPDQQILLQLKINQDRPSSHMVQGVPTISTRQMITNILVKSGQTIVLGGIYENNQESTQQALPFISQLPLLGWLFKQKTVRKTKRELLIFVTPQIMAQ